MKLKGNCKKVNQKLYINVGAVVSLKVYFKVNDQVVDKINISTWNMIETKLYGDINETR